MSEKKLKAWMKLYKNEDLDEIDKLTLECGTVQIWRLRWRELISWIIENQFVLSEEEQAYVRRFVRPEDRMRSMAGKILIRKLLAHDGMIPEETVHLTTTGHGKPCAEPVQFPGVDFNVSHSGELVVAAIGNGVSVGIDVEAMENIPEYLTLAEQFFTAGEWNKIKDAGSLSLFYEYWTAKEAYVKATGMGLYQALNSFWVTEEGIYESAWQTQWRRQKIEVPDGYCANLVYRRMETE